LLWGTIKAERGCVGDQPQQLRNEAGINLMMPGFSMLRLVEDDTAALQKQFFQVAPVRSSL